MRGVSPICRFSITLAAALTLAGCASTAAPAPAPAPPVESTPAPIVAAPTPTAASEPVQEETPEQQTVAVTETSAIAGDTMPAAAASERPAWQAIPLTDARTGAAFTLADFAGKTVFVEPFATWCSNCRQQLANVHTARQQAGENVVFVALSVEPNIGNEALAAYAEQTGYDLVFAAMPPELLQALAAQFGQTVANPPATPHFLIHPDGTTSDLVTGIETAEAILAQVGM